MEWKFAEAKNKLSELLNRAEHDGPQEINRCNKVFVVIEREEYLCDKKPTASFKDWLLNGPDISDLDLTRDRSPMRDVDL
jgi:prevent-host-death family protein